jgi:hypothetical protein
MRIGKDNAVHRPTADIVSAFLILAGLAVGDAILRNRFIRLISGEPRCARAAPLW